MALVDTLEKLCAQYLGAREFELDEATKDTARRACRWFDESEAAVPLPQLNRQVGDRFKNWLVATGRSPTTANMYLRAIRPILRFGVDLGLWPEHPWRAVRQFLVEEKPVTIYEDWQFERMLYFLPRPTAADPQRDLRWLAILWGARTTGFRRGALLNLTWDNIRGGLVWCEPKKHTSDTWLWIPKMKRIYKVPLAPQFAEALSSLKGRHYPLVLPATAKRLVKGELDGRWRKLPEINFGRTFAGIQRRAFGKKIGDFHQFRRTFTTDLAESLPDRVVMELTNHTRRETLNRYTAVRPSHWTAAYQIVARIGKRAPGEVCNSSAYLGSLPIRGPENGSKLGGAGLEPATSCV